MNIRGKIIETKLTFFGVTIYGFRQYSLVCNLIKKFVLIQKKYIFDKIFDGSTAE
jgi:hypothetical protein